MSIISDMIVSNILDKYKSNIENELHKIADEGATDAVVTKVTKRVNGGTIGLEDRIKHFKEYHTLLA